MARVTAALAGIAGRRFASVAQLSRNRRTAWLMSCAVSWLVCVPFFGPLAALVGLLVPGLAFSPQVANLEFVLRHHAAKDIRFTWAWRQLIALEQLVLTALLTGVTAASLLLVQPLEPLYRWTLSATAVLLYLGTVAFTGVGLERSGGRAGEAESSRTRVLERFLALGAATTAAGLGAFAWAVRRIVLPVAYGELEFAKRWQPLADGYAWLDGQIHTSLAGPSFEQSYWPLLPAGAGLVAGLATLAAREAAVRAATARIPFANEELGSGGKVFLSYSRRDTDFARSVTDRLEGHVREIWVDWQAIKPSEKWRRSIADGIRESDAMVVLVSRSSLASPYCWDEVRQAIEERKRILPVVIEAELATGTTAALREAGWDELTEFQRLDMSRPERFEEDVRRVVAFTAQEHRWVSGHTRLGLQAHEWWESGRSDGFLLREDELRAARWLRDYVPNDPSFRAELTEQQHRFIEASGQALRRRRLRFRTAVVSVLLVLAGLSSLVVAVQSQAETQRRQTLSRALVVASANQSGGRIDTSSLLAAAAYGTYDTAEARNAMADRLTRFNHAVKVLPGLGEGGAAVQGFAFSADGSTLAVELTNGTTQVWDTGDWHLRGTLRGVLPNERGRGMSADGRLVALLSGTRITVTDTTTMRETASFDLMEGTALVATWTGGLSADGRTLVGDGNWLAQIWSVPERREVSQRYCLAMSLSPSGRWAWCQQDGETWLRDLQAPDAGNDTHIADNPTIEGWTAADEPVADHDGSAEVVPAGGHGQPWRPEQGWLARTMQAVSEDGRRVLLRKGTELQFAVWDLQGRTKVGDVSADQLTKDGKAVSGPATDEQLATLMGTASTDGMVLTSGGDNDSGAVQPVESAAPGRPIALTADGRRAAGRTESGTLAVWDRGPGGRFVSQIPVDGLKAPHLFSAVSPDGGTVAMVDGTALRLFDIRTGRVVREPIRLSGTGQLIAYSRDGSQLAVSELITAADATKSDRRMRALVEVFALPSGAREAVLDSPSHSDSRESVNGLAFAPDGRRLYVGVQQAMAVYVWDLTSGQVVHRWATSGYLDAMALSPDGRWLATVDRQYVLTQWDTTTGKAVWSTSPAAAYAVTFSQDGRALVAPSTDLRSLVIRDASTHQQVGTQLDIGYQIRSVQVTSLTGVAVVTLDASVDGGAVQLWDLQHHTRIGPVVARVGSNGSVEQLTADGTRAVAVADGTVFSALVDPSAWKNSLCALVGRPLLRREWTTTAPKERYLPTC
ncbi:toll/interleukin-1 receptor domain-containing protein [Kitasatospora sp. GP82]|uniref:toll/interleukin-1 receptor domain-containing protein n=1 Tax=Kitasatospora sp. GP82 TaxID=3035089 RepID=UPI002473BF0A|nr:toll/interleukin-1 receptor domain-containing protein [Kitasatospora sp. GP82]MDH6127088.1 WD40 repeat protein [Kitasatospora sp. GP82]